MDLQHINVKIFVEGELPVSLEAFVEEFHQWVRDQNTGELLIDIADYQHVPAGPGILLIGLEADYAIDHSGERYGLKYNRKGAVEGGNIDRLGQALTAAVQACLRLETRFSDKGLKFSRTELEVFINDRAVAPNTDETWSEFEAELKSFLAQQLKLESFQVDRHDDPRARMGAAIRTSTPLDFGAIHGSA